MQFSANGVSFIGITALTGIDKIEKFYLFCLERDDQICALVAASEERRNWNMANPDKGKDWPAFRALDRMRNELCKLANIVDS